MIKRDKHYETDILKKIIKSKDVYEKYTLSYFFAFV